VLLPEARLPAPVAPRCVGTQTPPRERRRGGPSRAARDGAWPNSTCVTGSVCCHMRKLQEPKLATPRRGRPATPGRTALARQDADIPPQVLQRGIDQIGRGIILIPVRRQSPARLPAAEMERSYAAGRSARHDLLRPHDQGGVDVFLADPPPAVFLRHAENGDDFAGPAGKDCPVLNGDFPALFGLPQHVAVEDLHGHLVLHEEHADAMPQRITHPVDEALDVGFQILLVDGLLHGLDAFPHRLAVVAPRDDALRLARLRNRSEEPRQTRKDDVRGFHPRQIPTP
jgi:hypothetical protein